MGYLKKLYPSTSCTSCFISSPPPNTRNWFTRQLPDHLIHDRQQLMWNGFFLYSVTIVTLSEQVYQLHQGVKRWFIVDSVPGLGPGVPGSIPSSSKNFVFRYTLAGFESQRPSHRVTFSMGMWVQAESLLIMHVGKH